MLWKHISQMSDSSNASLFRNSQLTNINIIEFVDEWITVLSWQCLQHYKKGLDWWLFCESDINLIRIHLRLPLYIWKSYTLKITAVNIDFGNYIVKVRFNIYHFCFKFITLVSINRTDDNECRFQDNDVHIFRTKSTI